VDAALSCGIHSGDDPAWRGAGTVRLTVDAKDLFCTGPKGGEGSLFFGLTSDHPPKAANAQVMLTGGIMAKRPTAASAKAPTRAPAY
jgi:hypothetical protein